MRDVAGKSRKVLGHAPPTAAELRRALRACANAADAALLQKYFQTGPGGYAEGDRFLGVRVPAVRAVARANRDASLSVARTLLRSRWHEERLLALLLMVDRYRRGDVVQKQAVFDVYLANFAHVDNWDLVDSSAPGIVGAHLAPHDTALLDRLAQSGSVWSRRVAMLATLAHIKRDEFTSAFHVAGILLHDPHHLIHKAVGWMLREIGARDRRAEVSFLDAHWHTMPRTAVRYAIEHFTPAARRRYAH